MRIIDRVWSFIPANVVTYLAAYYHALTHVELITKPVDGAWLFRSGGPWSFPGGLLSGPVVNGEAIRAALRRASAESSLAGGPPELTPLDVRLLDINLLNPSRFPPDQEYVDLETSFFAERRNAGDFLLWRMNGVMPVDMARGCRGAGLGEEACPMTTRQPQDVVNATTRGQLASTFPAWDPDDMHGRVKELHSLVRSLKNTAVFFHCSCGCDRTGQLFAAYAIAHLNWTVQTALNHNVAIAGRPLWYEHQVSIQWYCESLRASGQYLHNDCSFCGDGNVPCAALDYYLDPFMLHLDDQLGGATLGIVMLGIVLCALRRHTRCCHNRHHQSSNVFVKLPLTPPPFTQKVNWLATPSTTSPASSAWASSSPWTSLFASPLLETPVDRATSKCCTAGQTTAKVHHDERIPFEKVA